MFAYFGAVVFNGGSSFSTLVLSKRRKDMSSQLDPPIIISGGSITIKVPAGLIVGLPLGVDLTTPLKQIKRVEISGSGLPSYDEAATNSDITITIEYGNP
jgi:hypothetical protein